MRGGKVWGQQKAQLVPRSCIGREGENLAARGQEGVVPLTPVKRDINIVIGKELVENERLSVPEGGQSLPSDSLEEGRRHGREEVQDEQSDSWRPPFTQRVHAPGTH